MAAIAQMKSLGLTIIKAVICHQGFLFCPQKPRGDSGQTLFLSFTDLESELVMFNPPHLLKSIRDNLLKTLLLIADGVVSWNAI